MLLQAARVGFAIVDSVDVTEGPVRNSGPYGFRRRPAILALTAHSCVWRRWSVSLLSGVPLISTEKEDRTNVQNETVMHMSLFWIGAMSLVTTAYPPTPPAAPCCRLS